MRVYKPEGSCFIPQVKWLLLITWSLSLTAFPVIVYKETCIDLLLKNCGIGVETWVVVNRMDKLLVICFLFEMIGVLDL